MGGRVFGDVCVVLLGLILRLFAEHCTSKPMNLLPECCFTTGEETNRYCVEHKMNAVMSVYEIQEGAPLHFKCVQSIRKLAALFYPSILLKIFSWYFGTICTLITMSLPRHCSAVMLTCW